MTVFCIKPYLGVFKKEITNCGKVHHIWSSKLHSEFLGAISTLAVRVENPCGEGFLRADQYEEIGF